MRAHYQILGTLKKIDDKVLRLKTELEKIPLELAKFDTVINERKEKVLSVKQLTDESEKKLRRTEADLREKEDFLKKAESKMMEVKTNEEYQAAIKENETHKTEKTRLEEQVLNQIASLEDGKKLLTDTEAEFKTFEATFTDDKKRIEDERSQLARLFEEQMAVHTSFCQQLSKDVKALYERTVTRSKGTAIITVENGMCVGCNMKIRSQLYNEVLGAKILHTCPNCRRILICDDAEDPSLS